MKAQTTLAGALEKSFQIALLAAPWINTYGPGPSPVVPLWLATFACGILLWVNRRQLQPDTVLLAWMLAAIVNAEIGLLQYGGWTDHLPDWVATSSTGEAYGNLRQRNHFASLMNIGVLATLATTLTPAGKRSGMTVLLAGIAGLLTTANAASLSRTGLLGLVLIVGLTAIWGLWRTTAFRTVLLAGLASYVLASLLLPAIRDGNAETQSIWSRLQQGDPVCDNRTYLWRNVLHLISLRPWTGWGLGELDFAHFTTLYNSERFCRLLDNAHNLTLHLAVELGLPAAFLLCTLVLVSALRKRPWTEQDPFRQAAWGALGIIALHSMFEYPLWYGPFQLTVLLCGWLLTKEHATQHGPVPTTRKETAENVAVATALLAATAYAAWDYHRVAQIYLPPGERSPAYRNETLEKVRRSWLFHEQAAFAEFNITPLTSKNAAYLFVLGQQVLHYSPEPRVVEKLIECSLLLNRGDDARFYIKRFQTAYPAEFEHWTANQPQRRVTSQ